MLTLLVCHTITDPMRISLVFKKTILIIFGQGYQRWKFLFFRLFGQGYQWWKFLFFFVIFGKGYKQWSFCFSWSFLAKVTNGESFLFFSLFGQGYQWWKFCFFFVIFGQEYQWWKFLFFLVIFGQGHQRWKFLFFIDIFGQGYFYWPLRLWIPMMKVLFVIWDFEQPSGIPLCQTRVRIRWRQSLAPHCASRSSRSGRQLLAWDCKYKRWHASTSISYPEKERVNLQLLCNKRSSFINHIANMSTSKENK